MSFRVAVFASGGGSNFQALAEHACSYRVSLLVSNRKDAGALQRAKQLGIPAQVLSPGSFQDERLYVEAVTDILQKEKIDMIALAGYLAKIPAQMIRRFPGPILNIHPSLLPRFGGKGLYGKRVHEAVLQALESISGATVHFVDKDYDTGPILLQESVPVLADDTPESLAARVLKVEHRLFPKAVDLIARGLVQREGRHITIHQNIHDH